MSHTCITWLLLAQDQHPSCSGHAAAFRGWYTLWHGWCVLVGLGMLHSCLLLPCTLVAGCVTACNAAGVCLCVRVLVCACRLFSVWVALCLACLT